LIKISAAQISKCRTFDQMLLHWRVVFVGQVYCLAGSKNRLILLPRRQQRQVHFVAWLAIKLSIFCCHCQYHACWHHYLLHYGMVERHGFFCLLQGIGLFVRNDMEFRFCYTKTGVADGSLL